MNKRQRVEAKIVFDEEGFTFKDKRVEWTVQTLDDGFPPMLHLFVNLNEAQRRWNSIKENRLTFLTEAQANEGLLVATSQEDIGRIALSVMITAAMEQTLSLVGSSVITGKKDNDTQQATIPAMMYRYVTLNPAVSQFLSVLRPEEITVTFIVLDAYPEYCPIFVPSKTPIEDADFDSHEWVSNPMKPFPKLQFERTTGRLLPTIV